MSGERKNKNSNPQENAIDEMLNREKIGKVLKTCKKG